MWSGANAPSGAAEQSGWDLCKDKTITFLWGGTLQTVAAFGFCFVFAFFLLLLLLHEPKYCAAHSCVSYEFYFSSVKKKKNRITFCFIWPQLSEFLISFGLELKHISQIISLHEYWMVFPVCVKKKVQLPWGCQIYEQRWLNIPLSRPCVCTSFTITQVCGCCGWLLNYAFERTRSRFCTSTCKAGLLHKAPRRVFCGVTVHRRNRIRPFFDNGFLLVTPGWRNHT